MTQRTFLWPELVEEWRQILGRGITFRTSSLLTTFNARFLMFTCIYRSYSFSNEILNALHLTSMSRSPLSFDAVVSSLRDTFSFRMRLQNGLI